MLASVTRSNSPSANGSFDASACLEAHAVGELRRELAAGPSRSSRATRSTPITSASGKRCATDERSAAGAGAEIERARGRRQRAERGLERARDGLGPTIESHVRREPVELRAPSAAEERARARAARTTAFVANRANWRPSLHPSTFTGAPDRDLLARRGAERLRGVAAVDRERDVPVGVLVEHDVAGRASANVRRRARSSGPCELQLDAHARLEPDRSRCSRPRLSWTFPKRSTESTDGADAVWPTSGSGGRAGRASRGSIGGPSSASATPSERCAAAGEKTSRAWNVRDTWAAGKSGFVSSFASSMPPSRRPRAGAARCRGRRRAGRRRVRSASARRPVPTPGSTTATWTPIGMYGSVLASTSAPWRTFCRSIPCVMSMISRVGRDPLHDAVAHPDEVVLQAEVGQERDEHDGA